MIYLDNAASSHPKPTAVVRAVARQLRLNSANPGRSGHVLSLRAGETVFRTRASLARLFGTKPELVLFTQNTTDAINRALKGILREGDEAVISDLEHNSVLRPLVSMKRGNISFRIAETGISDGETFENFMACITPKTRLVFCTHASNVTGRILPINEIGAECRRRGILFGTDAAQTAGLIPIRLSDDPIDFVCLPGHKGLLGPQGTGALLLADRIPLLPLIEGGTGTDSLLWEQPTALPEGQESGTLNTPGIAGLYEGIRICERFGETVFTHESALREIFVNQIRALPEYRVLDVGERFVPTVSLVHESVHSEQICQALDRCKICTRGGYHCSALAHQTLATMRSGALRISFGYANTEKDVTECVKCLKKYQNYSFPT